MSMTKTEIAVQAYRLLNFLENNQLVQSNAICCRLENCIKDIIEDELKDFASTSVAPSVGRLRDPENAFSAKPSPAEPAIKPDVQALASAKILVKGTSKQVVTGGGRTRMPEIPITPQNRPQTPQNPEPIAPQNRPQTPQNPEPIAPQNQSQTPQNPEPIAPQNRPQTPQNPEPIAPQNPEPRTHDVKKLNDQRPWSGSPGNIIVIEKHPLWKPFREVIKMKQKVLLGQTKQAKEDAIKLINLLEK